MKIQLPSPDPDRSGVDPLSGDLSSASAPAPLSNGLTDSNFDVRFVAEPDGAIRMAVSLLGPNGVPLGCVSFGVPALSKTQQLVEALMTTPGEEGDCPPGARALEAALIEADLADLAVSSDLGVGTIGILAEYGDRYTELLSEQEIRGAFTVSEAAENIYHVSFDSSYLMTSTFLRFQEHYESPEFRGKVFSLDEFKAWYAGTKPHGEFSYYEDWGGFNIPSYVFEPFLRGDFDPLSEKEKALLSCFTGQTDKFYVIGTFGANEETLRHEVAHGLYYTNPGYRAEVEEVLDGLDLTPIEDHLESLGYHEASFRDECHAYMGDGLDYLEGQGIDTTPYVEAHEKLKEIYARYSGKA